MEQAIQDHNIYAT